MLRKPAVYNNQLKKLDHALPVGVRLTVENIESVSSEEMDLTLTFIMTQTWVDKRLAHGGDHKMLVPLEISGQIWTPDLVIPGSAMGQNSQLLEITKKGQKKNLELYSKSKTHGGKTLQK